MLLLCTISYNPNSHHFILIHKLPSVPADHSKETAATPMLEQEDVEQELDGTYNSDIVLQNLFHPVKHFGNLKCIRIKSFVT